MHKITRPITDHIMAGLGVIAIAAGLGSLLRTLQPSIEAWLWRDFPAFRVFLVSSVPVPGWLVILLAAGTLGFLISVLRRYRPLFDAPHEEGVAVRRLEE